MAERTGGPWRVVLAASALLALALFFLEIRPLLNPFLLFWVVVALLHPFRGRPGHALLVSVAAGLTFLWLLATTGFLLAPFVLALVLAYVLDPLVDRLEARGVNRSLAVLALALPVLGGVVALLVFGLPALWHQVGDLIERAPALLDRTLVWAETLRSRLVLSRFPLVTDETLARLEALDAEAVVAFLEERQADIARRVWSGVLGLGRGLGSVLAILGYVILTPVLTFYLLRDYDQIRGAIAELVPHSRRDAVFGFFRDYDRLLSAYLRGQMTVALMLGVITMVGLWIVRFPYAFLLGTVVAVFNLVPYLGLVLSLIPAVIIALLSGQVVASLIKVAVVYGVAQALEGTVISPRIVGGSVGLHPVWVVLALAVGGFFFGFVGLLVAVPLAVGVKLLVMGGLARYRGSGFFMDGARRGSSVPGGGLD